MRGPTQPAGNVSDSLLEAKTLTKRFGRVTAVDAVDLRVGAGEIRAIIGPNGSGKTTLLHLLSRTLQPTGGTIVFRGRDITRMPPHRMAHLGVARSFQVTNLFFELSVFENLRIAIQASRTTLNFWRTADSLSEINERAEALLVDTGLWSRRNELASSLSHGEQRHLEMGIALAAAPVLLLLDEPTAGMSPTETAEAIRFIDRLRGRTTVLLVEHDMDVVMNLADRITVLHQGRVIGEGPPSTIVNHSEVRRVYLGGDGAWMEAGHGN